MTNKLTTPLQRASAQIKNLKYPRVAVIADPHLGFGKGRGGTVWDQASLASMMIESFKDTFTVLKELNIGRLIVAGDMFDTRVMPPATIKAVRYILEAHSLSVHTHI